MTPDKRLDQIEPVLADVAQKTDRLIESNGQILEIATRADANAAIAARGVAELTIEMRQRFEQVDQRFEQVDQRFEQVDQQFAAQRRETNLRFERVDQQFGEQNLYLAQRFEEQKNYIDYQITELRQEINQKFVRVEQTQQQILTLLLDRLK